MQLNESIEIIKSLSNNNTYFKSQDIRCWVRQEEKTRIFIFSAFYSNEEKLEKNWEELRDHIAMTFQSQMLDKQSERWNVYMFFFVQSEVQENLKQIIEQDKFSTRKIIYDLVADYTDELVKETINNELFKLNIIKRESVQETLESVLSRADKEMFDFLNLSQPNMDTNNLNNWLKHLENE